MTEKGMIRSMIIGGIASALLTGLAVGSLLSMAVSLNKIANSTESCESEEEGE